MSILFPLPAKPVGDADMADLEGPRDDMAIQQYLGPLKYQKMLAWLQAMAQLTGQLTAALGTRNRLKALLAGAIHAEPLAHSPPSAAARKCSYSSSDQ